MKKIAKIMMVVGVAAVLTTFAAGQKAYVVAKVPNSNAKSPTGVNNEGQILVNGGVPPASSVSLANDLGVESQAITG